MPGDKVIEMVGRGTRNLAQRGLAATGIVTSELIEAALDSLRGRGAQLAVCTNKPEALSRRLLALFGWTEHFAAVVGGDTLTVRKPEAAPLREAIRLAGGGRAVLVGDSITDVGTARAADIPCVAVSYGFRDRPAAELGANQLIDRFEQLVAVLEKIA